MSGLIVALDSPDLDASEDLARQLGARVAAFKVGLTLFSAHGPEAVRRIGVHGPVFCDLKLHDIPHQVGLAATELAGLGVWMFTVHAGGGRAMIEAAVRGAGRSGPLVAAVTVLTSLGSRDLAEVGIHGALPEQVDRLAGLAVDAGSGAVVCSGLEIARLRLKLGPDAVLVVPGIRPAGEPAGDQSRVMTAGEAARLGAGYLVVGRPVTEAPDPLEAAERILQELATG